MAHVDRLWAALESRAPAPMIERDEAVLLRRITEHDAALVLDGFERGYISWRSGTHFDTLDRPRLPGGRWWLTEKHADRHRPCWEFIPQLAAYVELLRDLGYDHRRVLFDTPADSGQLDLAVMSDAGRVVVLGEAKKESKDLDALLRGLTLFGEFAPEFKRGDEPRQLAWRLWKTRAELLWLVAPSDRRAFQVRYGPLRLAPLDRLPSAEEVGLTRIPHEAIRPMRLP